MQHSTLVPRSGIPSSDPAAVADRLLHAMRDVPFPPTPISLHPVVLPPVLYDELHSAAIEVVDVLTRVARGLGADRAERMAALKVDPASCPLFVDDEDWEWRYASCIARPDVILTPDGIKFIECNAGGGVGSVVQTQLLAEAWDDAVYRDVPMTAHRPFAARADLFERMAADEGVERSVALFGSVEDLARGVRSTRYFDVEVDYLRRRGFTAEFFEPRDLMSGISDGRGGSRFALGLRHFSIQEWQELDLDWSPAGEALEAGCQLIASQSSRFLFNKKLFGLASEGRPGMSDHDREVVQRYLPWTRVVGDREVSYEGRRRPLPELLTAEQDRFVLKGATGMKGEAVLIGQDTDERTWRTAVSRAVREEDSVAQERLETVRVPMAVRDDDGRVHETWVAPVFGPNVIGRQPAGCLARYHTDGSAGVVSIERHGGAANIAVALA
ncbi:hypothetical protein ABZ307_42030 [Streptomyces griseorubiginosus]|uniref:hypothetical protein n=1 Tax=Streptomyces griseorubiginosus TaxID=67304 RepID=UPI0033A16D12